MCGTAVAVCSEFACVRWVLGRVAGSSFKGALLQTLCINPVDCLGGGSAAWACGTIGASFSHGDPFNTCLGDLVPWLAPIVPQASVVEVRPSRVGQRPGGIQPSGRCAPVRHYRGELALPGGGHMGKRHRGWRGTPL